MKNSKFSSADFDFFLARLSEECDKECRANPYCGDDWQSAFRELATRAADTLELAEKNSPDRNYLDSNLWGVIVQAFRIVMMDFPPHLTCTQDDMRPYI